MFFCQACQEKNDWPGILAYSYGTCEVCGDKAACYDVPSKFLPMPKPKINHETHLSHCCQQHGCEYGRNEECPVVLGGNQKFMCEYCDADIYRGGGWEDAHLLNEMYNLGEQRANGRFRKVIQDADTQA